MFSASKIRSALSATSGGGGSGASFDYRDGSDGGFGQSRTVSLISMNFGPAEYGRIMVAFIALRGSSTGRTISQVTIGGVEATIVQAADSASDNHKTAIAWAVVSEGTSGDVYVANSSGNRTSTGGGHSVQLYSMTGMDAGAIDFGIVTDSTTLTDTLTTETGGMVLASVISSADGPDCTFSGGVTELQDVNFGQFTYAHGVAQGEATGTSMSPQVVVTGGAKAMVVVSFRPRPLIRTVADSNFTQFNLSSRDPSGGIPLANRSQGHQRIFLNLSDGPEKQILNLTRISGNYGRSYKVWAKSGTVDLSAITWANMDSASFTEMSFTDLGVAALWQLDIEGLPAGDITVGIWPDGGSTASYNVYHSNTSGGTAPYCTNPP